MSDRVYKNLVAGKAFSFRACADAVAKNPDVPGPRYQAQHPAVRLEDGERMRAGV